MIAVYCRPYLTFRDYMKKKEEEREKKALNVRLFLHGTSLVNLCMD